MIICLAAAAVVVIVTAVVRSSTIHSYKVALSGYGKTVMHDTS